MEKMIGNELIFREIMKNFTLDEIVKLQLNNVSPVWNNAIKNYFASIPVLGIYSSKYNNTRRDHLKMSIAMNMDPNMILNNCISFETLNYLRSIDKVKEILSPFTNLEEFYLFRNCYLEDLIQILEILKCSSPNIKKLMFKVNGHWPKDYYLVEQNEHKNRLRSLLNEFKSLEIYCFHGSLNRLTCLIIEGFNDFDHLKSLNTISFISSNKYCIIHPLTLTKYDTTFDISISDYKNENIRNNFKDCFKALERFSRSVSVIFNFLN